MLAWYRDVLLRHERIVHITAQHSAASPRYHPEHAKHVLVVVLVIRAALAAYQHAAAAATCPQVLRVGRPRAASEVAALLHQLASTAQFQLCKVIPLMEAKITVRGLNWSSRCDLLPI